MSDDSLQILPKRVLKNMLKAKQRDIKTMKKSFRLAIKPQLAKVRYLKQLIAISK